MRRKLTHYLFKLKSDKEFIYILKGGGLVFFSQTWNILTNLVLNYIVAKIYGAAILGVIAIIASILNFVSVIGLSGMNVAALKVIPEHQAKYSTNSAFHIYKLLFRIVLINTIILSLLVFFNSSYIAEYLFNKPHLGNYIKLTALFIIPFTLYVLNESALKAFKKIKVFATIFISINTLKVIFLIILGYFITTQDLPIYIILMSFFFLFVFSTIFLFNTKYDNGANNLVKREKERRIRLFALPMFFTSASAILISTTDILILGYYLDESQVAIYYVSNRLSNLITFMLFAVNGVSAGRFSALYAKKEFSKLRNSSKNSILIIFAFALPVTLIYIFFGKLILSIFGDTFIIGYTALIILSLGKLVYAAIGSAGWLLAMTGNQKLYCIIAFTGGIINIGLNLILIPNYQIVGAAIASLLSLAFVNGVAFIYVKKKIGFWNFFI